MPLGLTLRAVNSLKRVNRREQGGPVHSTYALDQCESLTVRSMRLAAFGGPGARWLQGKLAKDVYYVFRAMMFPAHKVCSHSCLQTSTHYDNQILNSRLKTVCECRRNSNITLPAPLIDDATFLMQLNRSL